MVKIKLHTLAFKLLCLGTLFDPSVGFAEVAANCLASNLSTCSSEEVCFKATFIGTDGQHRWKQYLRDQPFVEEARSRGLMCGTAQVVECTPNSLDSCSVEELCFNATFINRSGQYNWKGNLGDQPFVDEARARGLMCGTAQVVECSSSNPEICSVEEVCFKATFIGSDGQYRWKQYLRDQPFVDEARSRGLMCGTAQVVECTQSSANSCSDEELCDNSTFIGSDGQRHWKQGLNGEIFGNEAKARNLLCGTQAVFPIEQMRQFFLQMSQLRRVRFQYGLKQLGYYSGAIDGLWGPQTHSAVTRYVEAFDLERSAPNRIVSSVREKVPSSETYVMPSNSVVRNGYAPQRTPTQGTVRREAGLVAIIDNPSIPASQAKAICTPQAENARRIASNSTPRTDFGSRTTCTGYGLLQECSTTGGSGGFWGGVVNEMDRNSNGRSAYRSTLASCLAQFGWRE